MKATGIVRRIDDLGRVIIPKEIRRTLHIKEGDPLEIFTGEGGVIFKKYDSSENVSDAVTQLKNFIENDDCTCKTALLEKVQEMEQILKKAGANND